MTLEAYFFGCEKGAIGMFYWITTFVYDAESLNSAAISLFDKYDHTMRLRFTDVTTKQKWERDPLSDGWVEV